MSLPENQKMASYLKPTYFIDSDNLEVISFANQFIKKNQTEEQKAISLYYAVRDEIAYDPYSIDPKLRPEKFKASYCLKIKRGFCGPKSVLYAACCRLQGIPCRLGFADVKNHLTTQEFLDRLQSDTFYFHSYAEVYLGGKWIKCTPIFNRELCKKFHLIPLDFDGQNDSLFHPYSADKKKFMEYLHDYGNFDDFPFELMKKVFGRYPGFPDEFFKRFNGDKKFEEETPV